MPRAKKLIQPDLFKADSETLMLAGEISRKRGTTVQKVLRLAMENMKDTKKPLGLSDKLGFGRYAHMVVEDVIRCDAGYARWLRDKCESRSFSDEVISLINELEMSQK